MDESSTPESLTLLIGRFIFDGASPESVAEKLAITSSDVDRAWTTCRVRLSAHFATVETREYHLLNNNELQARALATLKLLLDWRESALQAERIAQHPRPRADDLETDSS